LVEALVALVVLSIGLLGIAGLQITSLKANHGSATRTQAVYLAYDIIDRMRANPAKAIAGAYNIAVGATPTAGTVEGDDLIAWPNAHSSKNEMKRIESVCHADTMFGSAVIRELFFESGNLIADDKPA